MRESNDYLERLRCVQSKINELEKDTALPLLKKYTGSTRTNEMFKELYRKDENGKYIHSFIERHAIYGITGEPYVLKDENGKE